MADEEQHGLALLVADLQAFEDVLRHPYAFERVVVVAPLADVVKQQREHEELGLLEVEENGPEPHPITRVGADDPFEIADGQERVLVDGVLVVEVANDPPRDRLELGKHTAEQATVVHLREPRIQSRARLEKAKHRGAVLGVGEEIVRAVAIDVLLEARERLFRDFRSRVERRLERAEPRRRIARGLHGIDEPDAVA